MKRHYNDIKRMKWRSLTFTKSETRRRGRNLKKYQVIQARKNRSLKKTDGKKTTTKQPQKAPKTPEFVDTDSDDSDDEQGPAVKCIVMYSTENEQEPVVKQPQKIPKTPEFVDTDSDDSGDKQERQPKKASKIPKFVDTEVEQEATVKQPQKALKA